MSRTAEAALVLAATGLAVLGVLLVNLAKGAHLDGQTGLSLLFFVTVFGGLLAGVHRWAPNAVPYLIPLSAILTAVGFVMVYRLDNDLAGRQGWWIALGGGSALLIIYWFHKKGLDSLRSYEWVPLSAALLLIALGVILDPLILPDAASSVEERRHWLATPSFPLAEPARLLLVVFLAAYLADRHTSLATGGPIIGRFSLPAPRSFITIVVAAAAALGLLVYQHDLAASLLVFALFPIMFYMATNRPVYLAAGFGLYALGMAGAILVDSSLRGSLLLWIRPWDTSAEVGNQIVQGLFAMAAGGASGVGPGLGEPYLVPAAATSHVFAVVAEELGLAGSVVVLAAYVLLVATGFGIAIRTRDLFHKLLAAGLSLLLGLQTILLVAGIVRLLPPSALTAPFMSYGGAATIGAFALLSVVTRLSHEEGA